MIELGLILACAPGVDPSTIKEIVRVESAGNQFAVNINTKNGVKLRPTIKINTMQEAIAVSYAAIERGHTVDMGYMQINSANLKALGYTIENIFYPCANIKAGAAVLSASYARALPKYKNEQAALRAALSAYNTGNFQSGFENGYVMRYFTRK